MFDSCVTHMFDKLSRTKRWRNITSNLKLLLSRAKTASTLITTPMAQRTVVKWKQMNLNSWYGESIGLSHQKTSKPPNGLQTWLPASSLEDILFRQDSFTDWRCRSKRYIRSAHQMNAQFGVLVIKLIVSCKQGSFKTSFLRSKANQWIMQFTTHTVICLLLSGRND